MSKSRIRPPVLGGEDDAFPVELPPRGRPVPRLGEHLLGGCGDVYEGQAHPVGVEVGLALDPHEDAAVVDPTGSDALSHRGQVDAEGRAPGDRHQVEVEAEPLPGRLVGVDGDGDGGAVRGDVELHGLQTARSLQVGGEVGAGPVEVEEDEVVHPVEPAVPVPVHPVLGDERTRPAAFLPHLPRGLEVESVPEHRGGYDEPGSVG